MRTQSSVAVSADGERWFLINASPDLRAQIEAFPALQPRPETPRNSPVRGVFLTNADLDHVLGLVLLREGGKIGIHATQAVRESLEEGLNFGAVLGAFSGMIWQEPTSEFAPLVADGVPSGLLCRAIGLPGGPPRYLSRGSKYSEGHSIAYQILDERTGRRLLIAADVASVPPELQTVLEESDAVLFDGTFWSAEELRAVSPGARTSAEMGHLTISGESLEILRALPAARKIYLHINNTNPILDPDSPQRAEVDAAGIVVGEDGYAFEL